MKLKIFGPNGAQIGPMGPELGQCEPKMGQWAQTGPNANPNWAQWKPKLAPIGSKPGPNGPKTKNLPKTLTLPRKCIDRSMSMYIEPPSRG